MLKSILDLDPLTYFPPFNLNSLLGLQRMEAGVSVMVLDEAVRAFHGDLGDSTVFVEDVEEIALGNLLGVQIACSQSKYNRLLRRCKWLRTYQRTT